MSRIIINENKINMVMLNVPIQNIKNVNMFGTLLAKL